MRHPGDWTAARPDAEKGQRNQAVSLSKKTKLCGTDDSEVYCPQLSRPVPLADFVGYLVFSVFNLLMVFHCLTVKNV